MRLSLCGLIDSLRPGDEAPKRATIGDRQPGRVNTGAKTGGFRNTYAPARIPSRPLHWPATPSGQGARAGAHLRPGRAGVGCPQHAAPCQVHPRQSAKGRVPTGAKPRWAGLSSLPPSAAPPSTHYPLLNHNRRHRAFCPGGLPEPGQFLFCPGPGPRAGCGSRVPATRPATAGNPPGGNVRLL